jgi:hypothetical protein
MISLLPWPLLARHLALPVISARRRRRTLTVCFALVGAAAAVVPALAAAAIDREALVRRHAPKVHAIEPGAVLTVGNGQFAFTVDVTGLQTLGESYYSDGMPLETLARWAWHENPNPDGFTLEDASEVVETQGRPVSYPTRQNTPAGRWLRENPHDHPLAWIGFVDRDGQRLRREDLGEIDQTLDLWQGEIRSRFHWRGRAVAVTTAVHPHLDSLAVRVRSAALADGALQVALAYPRGHDLAIKNTPPLDWSAPETHHTLRRDRSAGVFCRVG